MSAGNKNVKTKRVLSKTAIHHIKTEQYEPGKRRISSEHMNWDYHDFVERALKVILTMRLRDKAKYNQRQK